MCEHIKDTFSPSSHQVVIAFLSVLRAIQASGSEDIEIRCD